MNGTIGTTLAWLAGIAALAPALAAGKSYTISTAAGGANTYYYHGTGDGGPATSAGLANFCNDVAADGSGNLYIAAGTLIRKISPTGIITTFAGGGSSIGDGVLAATAELAPLAIATDAAGNLYIADAAFGFSRIRKVDTTGIITTVAGGDRCCALGDGGAATSAYLAIPYGLAVDAAGNLYIAQVNANNNLIRKVSTSGIISTVAGGGPCCALGDGGQATSVSLARPVGVAVDTAGNLYIAEAGGNRVRMVAPGGVITTVAGSGSATNAGDGGLAVQAGVDHPWHVAVDAAGDIFITQINDARVRLVTPDGLIATVAGNGTQGFSGDGGLATSAMLDHPAGIAIGRQGAVYFTGASFSIARVRVLTQPLRFVPVTPCRVVDTRHATGPFGGPSIPGGASRDFNIPAGTCNIPTTAQAYSLNVTVVPVGSLGYLTLFPAGQTRPVASTLNSLDGRIKSNAAIVPAGTSGAVSVFVSNTTQVVLDINGYFIPATDPTGLAFYPITPCRIADTRKPAGPLAGPLLAGGISRNFPIQSTCNLPATAQAYSLNITVVPSGPLGYLTTWPTGQTRPVASSLNAPTGTVTANAAIVPAGTGGSIDVFASNNTDLVIDVNGYFAPMGTGGLSLYNVTPCRVTDTRKPAGSLPITALDVSVSASACGLPDTAQAHVFNVTVVPPGPLGYLTLWPQGQTRPLVSTLNALDGAITSNLAIVPTTNGSISAFASNPTHLVLDISGYFGQ